MCLDRYAGELADRPGAPAQPQSDPVPDPVVDPEPVNVPEDNPQPEMVNDEETNGGNRSGEDQPRRQEDIDRIQQLEAQIEEVKATAEAEKAEINDRLSSEVSELRTQLDVMTQQIEN